MGTTMDYEPMDLAALCNAGQDFANIGRPFPTGVQSFRGIPFLIGSASDDSRLFIGFGVVAGRAPDSNHKPVTVPVARTARFVIFAHALLESRLFTDMGPVGVPVANYVIVFADGASIRLPIRERFEIGLIPSPWGHRPFLAVPHAKPRLYPRHEGRFDLSGSRARDAYLEDPLYFLWAWQNPHPEREIAAITIEPCGPRFLIAGITLGHLDEPPLRDQPKKDVIITLPRPEDAKEAFAMEVDVDRGVATFPYALPASGSEDFLASDRKGWGEMQNQSSSPAFVEIAARPSATITVKNAGSMLGSVNWGQLQREGKVKTDRVHLEVSDSGRNWVHVTVLDEETDRPIPCRVHFRTPRGIPYQPHGHHNYANANLNSFHMDIGGDVRLGQITYAYTDGACQGWLPRGELIVDVARGFEYEPLRKRVEIRPGQRELVLRIRRWTDMNRKRWFSGDTHVHFLGERGAHLEAQGEDLNVVNLLASQWTHLFTNSEDFIGRPTASSDGKTIVYTSQENRQHVLGHISLLGLRKPVYPLCSGGPNEAELGGTLDSTLARWADACHAQGGLVVMPHIPSPNAELAALIATGRTDAVEMTAPHQHPHGEYYRYLNCGYRLPLVGGTDKMTQDVPVGITRTYAHIPDQEFTYETWCAAVKAGRTFLSSGPMLHLTVDGASIGDTIDLPPGGGTVEVEAVAECIFPIHTLQIVQNGKVVATSEEKNGARRLRLKVKLPVQRHGWIAARCGGPDYTFCQHNDGWRRGLFAHTSPVYLAVGGPWQMFDPDTATYMLTLIDGSIQHLHTVAAIHRDDSVTHAHGKSDHMAWLEEPFREAMAAIHRRLHESGTPHYQPVETPLI